MENILPVSFQGGILIGTVLIIVVLPTRRKLVPTGAIAARVVI